MTRRDEFMTMTPRSEARGEAMELSRREVLKLMTAVMVLGVSGLGCIRKPPRHVISRYSIPEYQEPGIPLFYATTFMEGPVPYGMIAKTVDGHPVKLEGNPDHPVNRGASDAAMQAALLSLYDPSRLAAPRGAANWAEADQRIVKALGAARSVILMTGPRPGPTFRTLIERLRIAVPAVRHLVYDAVSTRSRRDGLAAVYGAAARAAAFVPDLGRARIVLSLDGDFLGTDGLALRSAADFAAARAPRDAATATTNFSRLYHVESGMTITGSVADRRIRLRPTRIARLATMLLAALRGDGAAGESFCLEAGIDAAFCDDLVRDLSENRERALVLAGDHLPPEAHQAVALLNEELKAPGRTLAYYENADAPASSEEEIREALAAGPDLVLFFDINPAYGWSEGPDAFASLVRQAALAVGHGLHDDETLAACHLALPSSHGLESWGDANCLGMVESLCQPAITPLFDSREAAQSLLHWTRAAEGDATRLPAIWRDLVRREFLSRNAATAAGESEWRAFLRSGVGPVRPPSAFPRVVSASPPATDVAPSVAPDLVIRPHRALWDGRFAFNPWLQELPDPVTRQVWGNGVSISPATAARLDVVEGDELELTAGARSATLAALIQPGMADETAVVTLGHGRELPSVLEIFRSATPRPGDSVSVLLGSGSSPRCRAGIAMRKTGARREPVRVQKTRSSHGRPLSLSGTLDDYRVDPAFVKKLLPHVAATTLYPPQDFSKNFKWEMAIDLSRCTGCSVCVTACQAENNIPAVGAEECARGREMFWMRIDRYEDGPPADPVIRTMPMLCQQCDNAPCENVCPVNATPHGPEGLNEMVYNRCVGTRYCANNCPYKVRRFNFFDYQKRMLRSSVWELAFNPQVTVRSRGVMEKCTFCVQRINRARFDALNRGEPIPDGLIQPACAQACPSGAIVFGNILDPASEVRRLSESPRRYGILEELNTGPAVHYLARITNPGNINHE